MIHKVIIANDNGLIIDEVLDAVEFAINNEAQIDFVFASNVDVYEDFPKPKKIVINKSGTKQIHLNLNPLEILKYFNDALSRSK